MGGEKRIVLFLGLCVWEDKVFDRNARASNKTLIFWLSTL